VRLFEGVRDHVRYTFMPWNARASDTLASREGMCTNKSNLLVALLRASRIPAAYGVLRVNPREYYGVIAPDLLKPLASTRSIHVYAAAFLDDRWVRCDPSTDADIAAKTSHFCRQTRLIHWDGRQDALDFLQPQHVYGDEGLHANIDHLLDKPPRHAKPGTLAVLNAYTRFIREHPPFESAAELLTSYLARARSTDLSAGDGHREARRVGAR
jgi:hypothetical protein